MKINFLIKHVIQLPTRAITDEEYELLDRQSHEYSKIMTNNGYDYSLNDVEYKSEEFFKILELAEDRFNLAFDFNIIYNQEELKEFNYFRIDASSSISMKNDITYSNKFDKLSQQELEYDILCSIMQQKNWTHNKMIVISQSKFAIDEYLYRLIADSNLVGYKFQQIYNITKKEYEHAYCLSAYEVIKQNNRVMDKLIYENPPYGLETHGYLIFLKDTFNNKSDFYKYGTDEIFFSAKARNFFRGQKAKGIIFKPVYEDMTDKFNEYNEFIKEFANIACNYNKNHVVGFEGQKIRISTLVGGLI